MSHRCCVTLLRSRGLQRQVMPSICCMLSADMICALKYIRYDRSRNMRKGGLLLKTWSHSFSQSDLESTSVRAVDSSPHACTSMPPGPAVGHKLDMLLCKCPDWQQFRLVDMVSRHDCLTHVLMSWQPYCDARMRTCRLVASVSTIWSTNIVEFSMVGLKAGLEHNADHKNVSVR